MTFFLYNQCHLLEVGLAVLIDKVKMDYVEMYEFQSKLTVESFVYFFMNLT